MAKNLAFDSDGDSSRDRSTAYAPNTATVTSVNDRPAANENTSLNANLDTYFSEEKIIVPEDINVSTFPS